MYFIIAKASILLSNFSRTAQSDAASAGQEAYQELQQLPWASLSLEKLSLQWKDVNPACFPFSFFLFQHFTFSRSQVERNPETHALSFNCFVQYLYSFIFFSAPFVIFLLPFWVPVSVFHVSAGPVGVLTLTFSGDPLSTLDCSSFPVVGFLPVGWRNPGYSVLRQWFSKGRKLQRCLKCHRLSVVVFQKCCVEKQLFSFSCRQWNKIK